MLLCAPATGRFLGALKYVVAKLLTVEGLGRRVEAEVPLHAVGGGKGRHAWLLSKGLCLRAGGGDDNRGGSFPLFFTSVVSHLGCYASASTVLKVVSSLPISVT
jgi:hypothetical protein